MDSGGEDGRGVGEMIKERLGRSLIGTFRLRPLAACNEEVRCLVELWLQKFSLRAFHEQLLAIREDLGVLKNSIANSGTPTPILKFIEVCLVVRGVGFPV